MGTSPDKSLICEIFFSRWTLKNRVENIRTLLSFFTHVPLLLLWKTGLSGFSPNSDKILLPLEL